MVESAGDEQTEASACPDHLESPVSLARARRGHLRLACFEKDVGGRDKPGHDDRETVRQPDRNQLWALKTALSHQNFHHGFVGTLSVSESGVPEPVRITRYA